MAIIAPFKGLSYDFNTAKDFSKLVAPPYDVISENEQEAYHHADPNNVIRLILGKTKTGDSDWDNRYTRAADLFKRWKSNSTLIRSNEPCIYLTSLTYNPGDGETRRTRWGLICLVRIEDEDSGVILPHEKTFSAHKADRLSLMRACNAQLSQIFGLYEDPGNTIVNAFKKAVDFPPAADFIFQDGTEHRLWVLQNPFLFKKAAEVMSGKSIFIADGHHRYETSRNFRDLMRTRYSRRPSDRSYEFVMMYLTNMSDEGLTILPSHRLIKHAPDFHITAFLEKAEKWFHIEDIPVTGQNLSVDCDDLRQKLEETGSQNTSIAFYANNTDQFYLLSLKPGARETMGTDIHPSLKNLDVLVLSDLILQKGLGFSKQDLDNSEIFHYESNLRQAVSFVQSGDYQMTFLLNPTKIEHVTEIAGKSLVMPRKSTYFYPKILTGLVFNELDPNEIIQVP